MTRRRSLTDDQIKQAKSMYATGNHGYGAIGKVLGIPASTVRDIVQNRSQYAVMVTA